jgi:hypothetical protein
MQPGGGHRQDERVIHSPRSVSRTGPSEAARPCRGPHQRPRGRGGRGAHGEVCHGLHFRQRPLVDGRHRPERRQSGLQEPPFCVGGTVRREHGLLQCLRARDRRGPTKLGPIPRPRSCARHRLVRGTVQIQSLTRHVLRHIFGARRLQAGAISTSCRRSSATQRVGAHEAHHAHLLIGRLCKPQAGRCGFRSHPG